MRRPAVVRGAEALVLCGCLLEGHVCACHGHSVFSMLLFRSICSAECALAASVSARTAPRYIAGTNVRTQMSAKSVEAQLQTVTCVQNNTDTLGYKNQEMHNKGWMHSLIH